MSAQKLSHVRKAIYAQPWAITEDWLEAICEIVENHVAGKEAAAFTVKMPKGDLEPEESYQVVNGVAILPLMGPIFPRANMMTQLSGATSLDEYGRKFDEAMADPEVKTILQHIDSPGGSVVGLSEMGTKIFEARAAGEKVICSMIEGVGCSAAYWLASQAQLVAATEGSAVGSIGIISKVTSADRMEKNVGIDSVIMRSNELKAPGVGPMTPRQEESMRKTMMAYFEAFKGAVARGRPRVDMDKASTGEVWIGADAKRAGLIDEVTTLPKLLAFLAS